MPRNWRFVTSFFLAMPPSWANGRDALTRKVATFKATLHALRPHCGRAVMSSILQQDREHERGSTRVFSAMQQAYGLIINHRESEFFAHPIWVCARRIRQIFHFRVILRFWPNLILLRQVFVPMSVDSKLIKHPAKTPSVNLKNKLFRFVKKARETHVGWSWRVSKKKKKK